jgi:Tfp pilus assembly protein PilF
MTAATGESEATDGAARLRAVVLALQASDVAGATDLAIEALAAGVEHPAFLNLRALRFEESERFEAALADLRRAHELAPRDFAVLNAIGLCLARMHRMAEAVAAFDQALALEPGFAPAHFNRGWALEPLGELAAAREAYEAAVRLKPDHVEALANLATLAARRGDVAQARAFAQRALAIQPGWPIAELALASAEMSGGDAAGAEVRLRALIARPQVGPQDRAVAQGQLGDVLDAEDRPDDAFNAYAACNEGLRQIYAPRFDTPGVQTASEMADWVTRYFEQTEPGRWTARDFTGDDGGEAGHVFLVGFPRSGTTLVEQVLAAHPDVVSLEERETLALALTTFLRDPASLDRLADLEPEALAPYRQAYWDVVRRHGVEPRGKVFIDKNPFNTIKLPLVAKLFPRAKVLFAVRDPRDVVFSCFRRRFGVNASTYEYLTLEGTARAYAQAMTLAELYRGKLGQNEHGLAYERMVGDFEGEVRAVCDFIGVPWVEGLQEFSTRARRGDVATASSTQVARGLYREGVGQWRRFAPQLAPVLPILAPWVARLGYPAE